MPNDIVFKTKTFGGFDKQEVLTFVNRILSEKADSDKNVALLSEIVSDLEEQNDEYKKKAELVASLEKEVEALKSANDELNALVVSKDAEIEALIADNTSKDLKIIELDLAANKNGNIDEDAQREIELLRSEVQRLKLECEKKRDIERQVGAAMLDARVHSEELVEEARERANQVKRTVYTAIGETAVKIDDLSVGIGEIARNFTKSVEEVELRIKALTGDMSKTAQLLITEGGMLPDAVVDGTTTVEYDFSNPDDNPFDEETDE